MLGLESMAAKILLSATVIGAALVYIKKRVPNEKIFQVCFNAGRLISGRGRSKLGHKIWEMIENFLEDSLRPAFDGFWAGVNEDDAATEEETKKGE